MLIEVHIEDGFVAKVTTDEDIGHEVVVLMGGQPERSLNTTYDATVHERREAARDRSKVMGYGVAVDLAHEALSEIARASFRTSSEMKAAINGWVQSLSDSLEAVDRETARVKPVRRAASKRPAGKTKAKRPGLAASKKTASRSRSKQSSRRAGGGQPVVGAAAP